MNRTSNFVPRPLWAYALAGLFIFGLCACAPRQFSLKIIAGKEALGARVYIDAKAVGVLAPHEHAGAYFSLALPPGKYRVEIKKEGYSSYREEIAVDAGESEYYLQPELIKTKDKTSLMV